MEITEGQKTAIIVGASGMVGNHLLGQLLDHPAYKKVRSLVRRNGDFKHERLEEIVIDFDRLSDYDAAFRGQDLFICLGTTRAAAGSAEAFRRVDHDYIIGCAEAGLAGGCTQLLLVSSAGADAESSFLYPRTKGETEQYVMALDYWATRIFRPSILMGDRNESRWGETLAIGFMRTLRFFTGAEALGRYAPVEAEDLAQAMAAAAQSLDPGLHIYEGMAIPELLPAHLPKITN